LGEVEEENFDLRSYHLFEIVIGKKSDGIVTDDVLGEVET
jgi:hypothetical protein